MNIPTPEDIADGIIEEGDVVFQISPGRKEREYGEWLSSRIAEAIRLERQRYIP